MIVDEFKTKPLPEREIIKKLTAKFSINPVVSALLIQRGFQSDMDVKMFFDEGKSYFHDPFLMKDMYKAVRILREAKEKKICVFCDYDVDGISSCAILYNALLKLGFDVFYIIPDRIKDGYDLNENYVETIKQRGADLLITADCGSNAKEAVELAKKRGMQVIVTDHHEIKTPASPHAFINPMQQDCEYPFKRLSGTGVAYKFILAYTIKYMLDPSGFENFAMDYLCIATIADMMPLTEENRIIARNGLKSLPDTNKPGIAKLLREAYLFNNITPKQLQFRLIPKLNSAGRMGKAELAYNLITANDTEKAENLYKEAEELNRKRLELEDEMLKEAEEIIEKNNYDTLKIPVVYSHKWLHSICGNIAMKLSKKYSRPFIVLGGKDENVSVGSGRAKDGTVDLFSAVSLLKDLLIRYGGHKSALGISIKPENIDLFREKLNENYSEEQKEKVCECDINLKAEYIDYELCDELEKMKPFGEGNEEPVFLSRGMKVFQIMRMGKDQKHTKIVFETNPGNYIEAVLWNWTSDEIEKGMLLDCAYSLEINEYNFQKIPQMRVAGLKICSS